MKCLQKWVEHNDALCSVCKTPLSGFKDVAEHVRSPRLPFAVKFVLFVFCWCVYKVVVGLAFNPVILKEPGYWSPFDVFSWVGASIILWIFDFIHVLILSCCQYLRTPRLENETYEPFDSYNDNDDDCV
jgi:hypothetical protein